MLNVAMQMCCLQDSGIDDDVVVMTEDYDDLMDEDAVIIPGASKPGVTFAGTHACMELFTHALGFWHTAINHLPEHPSINPSMHGSLICSHVCAFCMGPCHRAN